MRNFNPRSPHGERQIATLDSGTQYPISTHAPRTGSDISAAFGAQLANNFNPRSPHGERRAERVRGDNHLYFNPRSPHGERRQFEQHFLNRKHFNPRSPHGERRVLNGRMVEAEKFQPTLPARGATKSGNVSKEYVDISTHAPRTGSDAERETSVATDVDFNPRSPHGERRAVKYLLKAPERFQPTLPARGATISIFSFVASTIISTHAPRTGSDINRWKYETDASDFNPRSPHGERPRNHLVDEYGEIISTHAPRTGSDQGSTRHHEAG